MTLPDYAMNQETFPQQYERWLVGPLFRPWAEILLDEVRPSPRDRILDIACGTGIVARLAKQRLQCFGWGFHGGIAGRARFRPGQEFFRPQSGARH